jgi:hypothetical protein
VLSSCAIAIPSLERPILGGFLVLFSCHHLFICRYCQYLIEECLAVFGPCEKRRNEMYSLVEPNYPSALELSPKTIARSHQKHILVLQHRLSDLLSISLPKDQRLTYRRLYGKTLTKEGSSTGHGSGPG